MEGEEGTSELRSEGLPGERVHAEGRRREQARPLDPGRKRRELQIPSAVAAGCSPPVATSCLLCSYYSGEPRGRGADAEGGGQIGDPSGVGFKHSRKPPKGFRQDMIRSVFFFLNPAHPVQRTHRRVAGAEAGRPVQPVTGQDPRRGDGRLNLGENSVDGGEPAR